MLHTINLYITNFHTMNIFFQNVNYFGKIFNNTEISMTPSDINKQFNNSLLSSFFITAIL